MEELVAELLPRVRNLVRYLVRGDAEAEDFAQEAMVAIVRGLPSHRGEGTLQSWSDRVAVRAALGCLKRARRARTQLEAGADLEAIPHPDAPPDEYTARRRAVALLDRVPDDQRCALVMHHVLGMSVPDIAGELRVPLETVRSRLRIGMSKLRALQGGEP
jgi:RNA polymerase sigma-70 factor (ECF subfamily)